MTDSALTILNELITKTCKAGADAADALLIDSTDLSVSLRMGEIESLERSESGDLGLRVFIGQRQAVVSTTDRRTRALDELVTRALAMARLAPEDQFCGIAASDEIGKSYPDIVCADKAEFSVEQLISQAREAEDAARAVKGVTNSDGVSAGWGATHTTIVASNGFAGESRRTGYNVTASVIAGEGIEMQRDYDYAHRVFADDMPAPAFIGTNAGRRAVKRLNPRKMPTARVPVFFDPRISGGLVGAMIGAISGGIRGARHEFSQRSAGQEDFFQRHHHH